VTLVIQNLQVDLKSMDLEDVSLLTANLLLPFGKTLIFLLVGLLIVNL